MESESLEQVKTTAQEKSNFDRCPKCQSLNLREKEKPSHIELFCNECGSWVKWVPRKQKLKLAENKEPPEQLALPAAESTCTRCHDLDRLLKEMEGISRALSIITRAMINGIRQ